MKKNVLVVGLGQCGNKISEIFGKNGYDSIGINTAEEDMIQLNNIKKIKIGTHGGSGKDRNLAMEQLKNDFGKIFAEVKNSSTDKDIIILCSSLGGGTGSGTVVATAKNISKLLGKTTIVIGVLPIELEGSNLKNNALQAIAELDKIKEDINVMLIRNSSDYNSVNEGVFKKINAIFKKEGKAETSFDRSDLLNSFRGGYLDILIGNSTDIKFESNIYDLNTSQNINFVSMTRKKLEGDNFLRDYIALNKNFFCYRTSEKDSYFAIFSNILTPVNYINSLKAEIKKTYENFVNMEKEDVCFDLGIEYDSNRKKTVESIEFSDNNKFVFDF
ncbi:MAG: tubulin-like doman-containing protein [Cetobacterium sp.]